ncbi:MAG: WD40/YVTN/BNR-like repeat-containing protein, partial [Blastocatellia bacterium]
ADGGARWQAQTSGATQNLNDVFFVSAKEGWVASDRGVLLRTIDGGATWETVEVGTRANLTRLFFIAPDCGWVVGASGAIFRYGSGD